MACSLNAGKQAKSSAARPWENDIYENGNYFGDYVDFGDYHDNINADDYEPYHDADNHDIHEPDS